MHKISEITLENLSKIEGHASLEVKVEGKKVKHVKLKITGSKRFIKEAALGQNALAVHNIVSRICGTCSIAHMMGCIKAVEKALDVEVDDTTKALRELMMYGLNIRDHAMHLYLFCLPDVFNVNSVLEMDEKIIHDAFHVKGVGNKLSKVIGGRAVHSPFLTVGGFQRLPKEGELKEIKKKLEEEREKAIKLAEFFFDLDWELSIDSEQFALRGKYNFIDGNLCSTKEYCIPESNHLHHLEKVVKPYSEAEGFYYKGEPYIVGAVARMNLNKDNLNKRTKKEFSDVLKRFPSNNIFDNNVAQAIEILHCIDSAIECIEILEIKERKNTIEKNNGEGVSVIEAPRGVLFYHVRIKEGKIDYIDFVIPTAQNTVKMEKDIARLVEREIEKGKEKKEIEREIEKLIRAYDPCMTCATNFLKVKWS